MSLKGSGMGIGTSVLLAPKNTGPLLFWQSQRKRSPPLHTSRHILHPPWQCFLSDPPSIVLVSSHRPNPVFLPFPRSFHCDVWNSAPQLTNLSAFSPSSLNVPSTAVLTGICFPPEDKGRWSYSSPHPPLRYWRWSQASSFLIDIPLSLFTFLNC